MRNIISLDLLLKVLQINKLKKDKLQPRPPDIMKKGGAHKDKKKYNRKEKHGEGHTKCSDTIS